MLSSSVVQGMVFKKTTEGTKKKVENAKVAVYSCPVDTAHTETKVRTLCRSKAGVYRGLFFFAK